MEGLFGKVIDVYSRANAIEDGVLVDVSETAREAGIVFNTCVTRKVWNDIENIPPSKSYQDVNGRLWDVLFMLFCSIKRSSNDTSRINYRITMHVGRNTYYDLTAIVGPGDNGEGVITIKEQSEID